MTAAARLDTLGGLNIQDFSLNWQLREETLKCETIENTEESQREPCCPPPGGQNAQHFPKLWSSHSSLSLLTTQSGFKVALLHFSCMNWENFYPFKIKPHNLLVNSGTAVWISQSWGPGTAAVVQLDRLLLQMDAGGLQTTRTVDILNLNPPPDLQRVHAEVLWRRSASLFLTCLCPCCLACGVLSPGGPCRCWRQSRVFSWSLPLLQNSSWGTRSCVCLYCCRSIDRKTGVCRSCSCLCCSRLAGCFPSVSRCLRKNTHTRVSDTLKDSVLVGGAPLYLCVCSCRCSWSWCSAPGPNKQQEASEKMTGYNHKIR